MQSIWQGVVLGLAVGATVGLSACGGGGGGGSSPVSIAKCAPVAGAADDAQAQLSALSGHLAAIPQAGGAAADAARALISMVDAVDALAGAVQTIAATHDPQAFAAAADRIGGVASCGLDHLADALQTLDGGVLAGTPAAAAMDEALAQIEALQDLLAANPTGGNVDLGTVLDQLDDLAAQLDTVVALMPTDIAGLPETRLVLAALADSVEQFSDLLGAASRLDARRTGAALIVFYSQLADAFGTLARGHAGPLSPVVVPVLVQIEGAAAGVVPVLAGGLIVILDTVFDALRTVLGGSSAAPPQFEAIIMGLITTVPMSGAFADLIESLAGGGGAPDLADLLGGVPVLGALVAEILDSSGDPTDVLMDVLNGAPGMPTLVEVIGDLPGLGGAFPPSTDDVEELVGDLLEIADGVPVIADVLDAVDGQFTQANLDEVSGLLNGLLGGIL